MFYTHHRGGGYPPVGRSCAQNLGHFWGGTCLEGGYNPWGVHHTISGPIHNVATMAHNVANMGNNVANMAHNVATMAYNVASMAYDVATMARNVANTGPLRREPGP